MSTRLSLHLQHFDSQFKSLDFIDKYWYKEVLGVESFCKKSSTRTKKQEYSEEYIRARFLYALIKSGMYNKEYICVEFEIPKGNGAKSLKPDIVVFKNKDWKSMVEKAKSSNDYARVRSNMLVIFEAKNNAKSVADAIEKQLRSAMAENTSKDRIFGVYFDNKPDILIFKKIGNSEIRRFNEDNELAQDGINGWNLDKRDLLKDLPAQKDFEENNESIRDLSKLKVGDLDPIDESNFVDFMNALKRANDKIQPSFVRDLIVEFLTLKVFDEKCSNKDNDYCLKFYILPSEKAKNNLGEKSFRERIDNLYKRALKDYPNILGKERRCFYYREGFKPSKSNDEKFLIALIEIFQRRAILKAKNESFNQIIFNNFGDEKQKADKGQFFTPIPIVKNIIRMLNPRKDEELCDPCCGICDFPAMAFRHAHRKDDNYPSNANSFYGFDIESTNLKLAELNLVLNGDGGAVLERMDSLSQKLLEDDSVIQEGDFNIDDYDYLTWEHKNDPSKNIKKFKIIATNPPFGKGRDLKTGANGKWDLPRNIIELYETFRIKLDPNGDGVVKYPNSMDMGALFLENAYKCLEEGGRLAIVLSNSIASIREWQNVRRWFIERMRVVALFDLPNNTFGETGVATTVIIAYKPKSNEQHLLENDYEVFIKEIVHLGYEVKTKNRTVHFEPKYIINEETFETTSTLYEDFSILQKEFKEFLQSQEEEIKKAFHLDSMD
ncbi:HsdM family class I SAM-dependent methyltransferase [Helicobacter cetorum]|uniref:N-6 DNA methylase n=1 Tax=Helicobacter cetorum (strain ATCC BAA-540 / CCUG 52418 / MIT 99-5656) TaxID=1163745 RepID=I0ERJ8_HELCM|nr:N-6 DNA methylase [Helicobacter cetorum]AFI05567.1 N-6 DNA methylase [Helicobacter cetorum MIT 99-5656]